MPNAKLDNYLIEQFLHQKLSKEEVKVFKKRMEYDSFVTIVGAKVMGGYGDIELIRKLNEVHRNAVRLRYIKMTIFILFTILLLGGLYFYLNRATPDTSAIYATYFQSFEVSESTIYRDLDKKASEFHLAIKAYKEKDYAKAVLLFEKEGISKKSNTFMQLRYSIALLGAKKGKSAILFFKNIIEKSNSQFIIENAEWYLALAYLQINDITNAVPLLEKISTHSEDFRQAAKEILKKLD